MLLRLVGCLLQLAEAEVARNGGLMMYPLRIAAVYHPETLRWLTEHIKTIQDHLTLGVKDH